MAVTVASLKARCPEFVDTDTGLVQACLDEAAGELVQARFGARYEAAVTQLAAHKLSGTPGVGGAANGAAAGALTAFAVGGVSASYGAPAAGVNVPTADVQYTRSLYGQEYLRIRNSCPAIGFPVIG